MNATGRVIVFLAGVLGFVALYLWGLHALPGFGHYPGPYGDVLNALCVYQRHATDVVTAINFDYRGFDTVGEEFILFASVMAVLLLLRKEPHERKARPVDAAPGRASIDMSDAVRVFGFGLTGPLVIYGLYVVTHGQLTPGGGFQGGAILATVPLMLYVCGGYRMLHKITSHTLAEVAEASGAGGFVLIGLASFLFGMNFLANYLPLGKTGDVASAGTIAAISFTTGVEVAAGFVLVMIAYLEQVLVFREGEDQ